MLSCRHHTAIFIVSMFMLLLLKDLVAKFIITCTLKDKLTTWLCLVEGYLASLHNLVSFKIENTICSRVRCITKENTIDRPRLKLVQLLPFLQNKALAPKRQGSDSPWVCDHASTRSRFSSYALVGRSCLKHSTRYSPPYPETFSESYAHQASSEPSHTRFCFSFPQHHSGEAYTDSKTGVQDPSHGKRFQNESFRILSHCQCR
jgi:hypothetical protein